MNGQGHRRDPDSDAAVAVASPSPLLALDLGNVLMQVDFNRLCERLAKDSLRSPGEVRDHLVTGPLKVLHDAGSIGGWQYARAAAQWLCRPDFDDSAFVAIWKDIFSPVPGAAEFLMSLDPGQTVWLLSDTDTFHFMSCYQQFPLLRRMDRLLLSYERGCTKLESRAFEPLLDWRRDTGGPVYFVDDREDNCRRAAALGVTALLFKDWADMEPQLRAGGVKFRC